MQIPSFPVMDADAFHKILYFIKCKDCNQDKPMESFYFNKRTFLHSRSCYACVAITHRERREKARHDIKMWISYTLAKQRSACRHKNIPHTIFVDDVMEVYRKQDGNCALTGRYLVYGNKKSAQRDSISIDRIIPKLGYVEGNIRLVTFQANFCRSNLSDAELFAFCEDVIKQRG